MDAVVHSALAFGALGVFALMVPESAGLPIPSELTLMLAGVAVGQGRMAWWARSMRSLTSVVLPSALIVRWSMPTARP